MNKILIIEDDLEDYFLSKIGGTKDVKSPKN